jgi:type II secretion system protein G
MVNRPMIRGRGFTLIELLVVLAIIGTLLTLVTPRYFDSVERAKEVALRTDLRLLREAIDKYRADTGRLPESLGQLVQERYVRSVPVDPVTDRSDTWVLVPVPDGTTSGVYDVRSGAPGTAHDGAAYASW